MAPYFFLLYSVVVVFAIFVVGDGGGGGTISVNSVILLVRQMKCIEYHEALITIFTYDSICICNCA